MNRFVIIRISLVFAILSIGSLFYLPDTGGDAVRYADTKNGPKFRTLEHEEHEVTEYEEGQYYLVDEEGNISKTDAQTWKKNWRVQIYAFVIKLIILVSCLLFFGLGWVYPMFKTAVTKKNYLLPGKIGGWWK